MHIWLSPFWPFTSFSESVTLCNLNRHVHERACGPLLPSQPCSLSSVPQSAAVARIWGGHGKPGLCVAHTGHRQLLIPHTASYGECGIIAVCIS